MALFNPTMSQAPSTFNPISPVQDDSAANAINAVTKGLGAFSKIKEDADAAALEQQSSSAYANLFSDTLRTEAQVLKGQDALAANQQRFDALYADGQISDEERTELGRLQEERQRLANVTNPRQRQVQLRMKYANFVNRFPHLTKEARITFGDAESRLEEVAQGAQGLVEKEAFEEIYGKNYSAENISTFRNMQRYKAKRQVGTMYGESNFRDWSVNFEADVTTGMYEIGQRVENLVAQQGALRTEDIDTFNAGVRQEYRSAIQTIDQSVAELQKAGQYVPQERVQALKTRLEKTRDDMLGLSEGKDFLTRLENHSKAMKLQFEYDMTTQVGAITTLFSGEGGGGAKGQADLMTMTQILKGGSNLDAAEGLEGPYGDQVAMLRQKIPEYLNFLDNYDAREASKQLSPALSRTLAATQWQRIDNGLAKENPEAVKTALDVMDTAEGTSDEKVEGILSRSKVVNEAAIKNNETKAALSSKVNNYALETEQYLQDVNGRIRQTENGPEVFVSTAGGRFMRSAEGTRKLRNTEALFTELNSVGSVNEYKSLVERYTSQRNETLNQSVQELTEAVKGPQGVNTQLLSRNLKQLKIQFGLTDQEVAEISAKIRSANGPEASGG